MRKAKVLFHDKLSGILTETEERYRFLYDSGYLGNSDSEPVSLTLPMEDMYQLTERLTEHKYKGSHEQFGKAILKYANSPLLEVIQYLILSNQHFVQCH